jgi:DNA repair exonuclease SbcCD ATPase subunit
VLAFKEVSVELGPGFNVVLSPNEGGKSSLFRGIVNGLYANASSQKGDVLALARWGAGGSFGIRLEFRLGPDACRLVRDFGAKEQMLYRLGEEKPFAKGKAVDEFLAEHLHLADQDLFLRICGVRHEELALVGDGSGSIGERIEEILGGGGEDVTPARVQEIVEGKRKELLKGRDRLVIEANRGAVRRFRDDVERLEGEAAKASSLSAGREGLFKAISIIDSRLGVIDDELGILETKREKAKSYADLDRNERSLRERADGLRQRLKRIEELRAMRNELAAGGARFTGALGSRTAASLDKVREELAREALLEAGAEAAFPGKRSASAAWRPALASIFILAGAAGAVLWKPPVIVLALVGLALLVWHFARRGTGREAAHPAEKRDELERLRSARAAWAGNRSLDESKTLLAEYATWLEQGRDVGARLEEALGKGTGDADALIGALDAGYGAAAIEVRALAESRAALEPFRLDGDGMLRLDRDIAGRLEERERLAAERTARERELAGLERMDASDIAERLAGAREGLMRAERKVLVLDAILEALEEARGAMSGFLSERLPPLAGAYISRITEGRYATLFIDPLSLKIEVAPAAGDAVGPPGASGAPERVEPGALSQGTRDQIYLAVRLALVELMSGGESQPLFLDDPFVHFDPARRERALDLVREFARRHQVVMFTCDPRYREAGDRLVELPERA